ncbi:TetR/AcrR family transcriptional regulator [Agromyces subbeticus]|uniref:TetR/AcrR family transcriptional regulator n=1 Tax=Agromyces subbeticus TaxID=293890 RepID=UPI0003B5A162|nr:TetR/AcrR family transcriptional regulator [Agromyces subbeticus]
MGTSEARRLGRPRGTAGAALLDIARGQFLSRGFAGTTMDSVASAAHISKASLYRDYPSKNELFAAVVSDWVDRGRDAMKPHTDALSVADDPIAQLRQLAGVLQRGVLSPAVLQMRTLVAAEAARFPAIASDYVARSWERNITALANAFAVLSKRGVLHAEPAHTAAEQFTWLVIAVPLNRLTLEASTRPYDEAELDRIADEAVSTFLARFGPPPLH